MKVCIKTAFANADADQIVEDGAEDAAILIAVPGQKVHEKRLEAYSEAAINDFFVNEEDYRAPVATPNVVKVHTSVNITGDGQAKSDEELVTLKKAEPAAESGTGEAPKADPKPKVATAKKAKAKGGKSKPAAS